MVFWQEREGSYTGIIVKPYNFAASTPAVASQVNANFDVIYNAFNGNIDSNNLATNSVVTSKIADNNVTTAKINDSAVTTAKINDSAVTTAKINDSAVTSVKLIENFVRGRLQENTTNSAPTGLTMQFGWGYVTGTGSALRASKTVTFPTAFSSAPIILISPLGSISGSNPTAITDFTSTASNTGDFGWLYDASSISTTQFIATINRHTTNIPTSLRLGFSWIAIGTV